MKIAVIAGVVFAAVAAAAAVPDNDKVAADDQDVAESVHYGYQHHGYGGHYRGDIRYVI